MTKPNAAKRFTVEDLVALPDDGNRYEVVDGELFVTPAPSWDHQRIVGALHWQLRGYLAGTTIGEAILSPADVRLGDSQVEPDLFVFPFIDGRRARSPETAVRPLLVVEVLSPSTARRDRVLKRRLYQRAGVPEYWIVDLDARLVERWRPGDERPEIFGEQLEWAPESAVEPLKIDLESLFRDALGE
jgi:Uma2 family endonuclease